MVDLFNHKDTKNRKKFFLFFVSLWLNTFMTDRFQLLDQKILYREMRRCHEGEELRWVLTHEVLRDSETGETFERSLLRHPGVSAIVPITETGEIMMIEQYRYSAQRKLWEIPAGMLRGEFRDGRMVALETPEEAAARELSEEAGLKAGQLQLVQQFYTMPGTSGGLVYLFLALDLTRKASPADLGEVVIRTESFTIDRLMAMIATGEICDAKTILGIYSARNYQEHRHEAAKQTGDSQ
jgi:ADP-ribose pyrophosphatase